MKKNYIKPNLIVRETDDEVIVFNPPKMSFWKKYLIYCSIWCALIIIACLLTGSIVTQYDSAMPEHAMDEYMMTAKQDMFFSAISNTDLDKNNPYEPAYELSATLTNFYQDEFTYKRSDEFTKENPVFIIMHGDTELFKVTLEPHSYTGFMNYIDYAVKNIELIDLTYMSFSPYRVVFPNNAYIFINGHRLTTQLSGNFALFEVFESGRTAELGNDYYGSNKNNFYGIIIEDFAFDPVITALQVTTHDVTVPLECKRIDNYYIFDYKGAELISATITAPEDAEIYINSFKVSDLFKTDTSSYTGSYGSSLGMDVYMVPTIFKDSKIQAFINGSPLETVSNGSEITVLPKDFSRSVIIPANATLYVNGQAIDLSDEKIGRFDVFGTNDYFGYELSGFISEPDICAAISDGAGTVFLNSTRIGKHIVFGTDELTELTISVPSDTVPEIDRKKVDTKYKTASFTITVGDENSTLDVTEYTVVAKHSSETNITAGNLTVSPITSDVKDKTSFIALPKDFNHEVIVPYGSRLYINGEIVSTDYITEDGVLCHPDFDGIENYPKATKYVLPKRSGADKFVAEEIGKAWLMKHADGVATVFTQPYDFVLRTTYNGFATEYVTKYLNYCASNPENAKNCLDAVLSGTIANSPAYSSIISAHTAIKYSKAKSFKINSIYTDNVITFGEDFFTCDVFYTATVNNTIGTFTETNSVHLVFQKSNDEFKVAKIIF